MQVFNSLTRKKEEFISINSKRVGVYTCGPTIYDYPTIGNWRTYTLGDLVVRTLKYFDYKVNYVMNLTDVGHLSGDNLGDASLGEDRMAKASDREGVDAWGIADKYGKDFLNSFSLLNLQIPNTIAKATDHIPEQIELIKQLEAKGLTYKTSDGIYFNVKKYEDEGNTYGELSNIDQIRIEGQRIAENVEKRDKRDFALWKFFATGQKRHNMQWKSPWGEGYPGWHIECSAMSMKYLGPQFDIHIGGEDLKSTHHPNEIAQSESATGCKPFVKYWMHGAFLTVDGGRMGKSLGNAYNLHNIIEKGIDPLALRYFYLTAHYRKQQNFTWEGLIGAATALRRLQDSATTFLKRVAPEKDSNINKSENVLNYTDRFNDAISDDLNMPEALAVTWEIFQDHNLNDFEKAFLAFEFDKVLGLSLTSEKKSLIDEIPAEIQALAGKREEYRKSKDFDKADQVRKQIEAFGYIIKDLPSGTEIKKQ